jgi:hypothetical protein
VDTGADTAVDTGAGGYTGAFIEDSCGPADGPAVELTLYEALSADCTADNAMGTLVITVYGGTTFPIPPGTTITSTRAGGGLGDGAANLCPGGTRPCLNSGELTITFDEYVQDDHASGSYSITFEGGREETGTFTASWCDGDVLCG